MLCSKLSLRFPPSLPRCTVAVHFPLTLPLPSAAASNWCTLEPPPRPPAPSPFRDDISASYSVLKESTMKEITRLLMMRTPTMWKETKKSLTSLDPVCGRAGERAKRSEAKGEDECLGRRGSG